MDNAEVAELLKAYMRYVVTRHEYERALAANQNLASAISQSRMPLTDGEIRQLDISAAEGRMKQSSYDNARDKLLRLLDL